MNLDYILITKSGSHLYGTNHKDSDIDIRGIVYEPKDVLFGLGHFEQSQEPYQNTDTCFYGLKKFCSLALDCNPNIIELLFVPCYDKNIVEYYNYDFIDLVRYRECFLSKKCFKTFTGYAYSQFKRMETHHKWLTQKPPKKPNPKDYGRYIENEKEKWSDYPLKIQYDQQLKEFQDYENWLKNRNEKRHKLEEKCGFDSKNALHLVRLIKQYEELSTKGFIRFPVTYKDELLEVLHGKYTYDELENYMRERLDYYESVLENSVLPDKPNYGKINELVMQINYRKYYL